MAEALWWTLRIAQIDAGSAGALLPTPPGTPFVRAGVVLDDIAGRLFGPIGVRFLPLVGAATGEWLAQRDHGRAARICLST